MSTPAEPPFFLALRGQQVLESVLTPRQARTLSLRSPPATGTPLADLLPPEVRQDLSAWCAQDRTGLLVLDAALPPAWQQAPWESLRFEGQPLGALLLTVRRAVPVFGSPPRPKTRTAWLNLYPKAEFDFARALQASIAAERLTRIWPRWLARGLDGFDDLFVLAHGNANGLLDRDGQPFRLETSALPRRVWLLACNHEGAMYRLAETLLARGARTVVAATGEISAPEMAALLTAWCDRDDDVSLEDWLLASRLDSPVAGGIQVLTLLGEITLDNSEVSPWNQRVWEQWRHPVTDWPRLADAGESEFQDALRAIESPALWLKTLDWLLPQALSAAENRDHQAMVRLYQHCKRSARESPPRHFAQANACYRLGYYDLMAESIVAGLGCAGITAMERAELLGAMVNLLIDIGLSGIAAAVVDLHAECQINDFELRERQAFKRLDWRARIALRQHRFDEALRLFASKRQQNPKINDTRELAWLLYTAAWQQWEKGSAPELPRYRDAVLQVLDRWSSDRTHKGNDPVAYLLRALACCRWATGDETLDTPLARWLPAVETGLGNPDPGPWAFAGCFLGLADARFARLFRPALDSMERARYWLEIAGFAALGVNQMSEGAAMRKHEALCKQVLASLASWQESNHINADADQICMFVPPL